MSSILPGAHTKDHQQNCGYNAGGHRNTEVALQTRPRGAAPSQQRPNSRQEKEKHRDGYIDAIEKRRADRNLMALNPF